MTSLLTALVFVLLVVVVWQWREIRSLRNFLTPLTESVRRAMAEPAVTGRKLDAIYDQRWRTKDDLAAREQAKR